jgi:hypothetical protein
MDQERLLQKTLLISEFYKDSISRLQKEIENGCYTIRDFTIAGVYEFQMDSISYISLARANGIDYIAFDTSLSKMEQRLGEFTARRDVLLAQLGPEKTQRRLLEEVTILVRRYVGGVEGMMTNLREMDADEYEEYTQDEELYNLETLWLRNSVGFLLPLLAVSEAKSALELDLAQADATLQRHGPDMFGPLVRMGSIQQLREARFEPKEHWWWYLDETAQQ